MKYYPNGEVDRLRELMTVVTRKGQITVPAEIRKALGIHQGDKIALVFDKGEVRLRRAGSVVDQTAGMLKGPGPCLSLRDEKIAAEEAIAHEAE